MNCTIKRVRRAGLFRPTTSARPKPSCPRKNDEHTALGELSRVAVAHRIETRDRGRHLLFERGDAGEITGTACDDQTLASNVSVACGHAVPVVSRCDGRDRRVRAHRRRRESGETRDELDHLGHRHEAVGIAAVITIAGQPALPVWREEPQRIPTLAPPGVGHLAALEHHVIDRPIAETAAGRQACVAGADDDRGDGFDGRLRSQRPRQTTATVTFVGLVRASYTAERFCDCATMASISCFDASASI